MTQKIIGKVDESPRENESDGEDASKASWNRAVHLATGGAGGMKEQRENARVIREKHNSEGAERQEQYWSRPRWVRPPTEEDLRGQPPATVMFMDDYVVYMWPRKRDKVWRMRPPRPGHPRPVPAAGGQKPPPRWRDGKKMKKGRFPEELLIKVLRACAETGILVTVDLGPYYFYATVVMRPPETAGQCQGPSGLRTWRDIVP